MAREEKDGSGAAAVFLLILACATALRIHGIGQSFWYDEILSLREYFRASWWDLFTRMRQPNHHPLYSALAKLAIAGLGEKEWTARLPALLFGCLTPPLLHLFARRAGQRTAILAGVLAALSPWLTWFSQDARGYSAMIFFSLAATHLFLGLCEKPARLQLALYIGAAAGAIYSHMYAGAVIAGHFAIALVLFVRRREKAGGLHLVFAPTAALLIALLLYAPLLGDFLAFVCKEGQADLARRLDPAFLISILLSWSAGEDRPRLSLFLIAPAALGVAAGARRQPLATAALVLPVGIALAVALATQTFVYTRFFSFFLPGFLFFAAAGLEALLARPGRAGKAAWAAVALAVISLIPNLAAYHRSGKQGLRDAAEWIKQNVPGRRTVALGLVEEVYVYYDPKAVREKARGPARADLLAGAAVVVSHPWSVSRDNWLFLKERCREAKVFPAAVYKENVVVIYLCE